MSQNYSRNLATSRNFDSWLSTFPARPGSYYTQHREASSNAQMEAWTPYDGIPSAPQTNLPLQGNRQHRDPGRFDRPWRNAGAFDSNSMHHSRQSHYQQRERPRSAAPSPPPKRSKVPGSGFHREDRQAWSGHGTDVQQAQGASSPYVSSEFFDADYIYEHYSPIDREMYQSASNTLWENPKAFLWDSPVINAKSSFIVARGGKYRCNLVLSFSGGRQKMDVIGDGMNKVSHAAYRVLL